MPPMLSLCGKTLSREDQKVWKQAITLLLGLKIRNGFGEKDLFDLSAAVGKMLHRKLSEHCEDCGMKVRGKRGC